MHKIKVLTICFLLIFSFLTLSGCESFRKKFIRQPKHEPKKEEMVIVPKDYSKLQLPPDKAYIRYYTYWKAWHNELLTHLVESSSKKKIISCFEQAILNLNRMKDLLVNEEKITLLDSYISRVISLTDEVNKDNFNFVSLSNIKNKSDVLLLDIQKDFSISKVRDDLKW